MAHFTGFLGAAAAAAHQPPVREAARHERRSEHGSCPRQRDRVRHDAIRANEWEEVFRDLFADLADARVGVLKALRENCPREALDSIRPDFFATAAEVLLSREIAYRAHRQGGWHRAETLLMQLILDVYDAAPQVKDLLEGLERHGPQLPMSVFDRVEELDMVARNRAAAKPAPRRFRRRGRTDLAAAA